MAEEYDHGHLDWYSVDVAAARATSGSHRRPGASPARRMSRSSCPTRVAFEGMPNTRWWTFEDGRTNFGDVRPDTTDLAKLLLIEFGLVYANDWFLSRTRCRPARSPPSSGIAVTNVFGERTWVAAAGGGRDDDWQRWAMFTCSEGKGTQPRTKPALPQRPRHTRRARRSRRSSRARRIANMVWGIERTSSAQRRAQTGREAAYATLRSLRSGL